MWSLPGPGIEPVSSALADGFLSTVAPGESFRFGIEFTFHRWLSLSNPSISPRQNTYLKAVSAVLYLLGASKGPSISAPVYLHGFEFHLNFCLLGITLLPPFSAFCLFCFFPLLPSFFKLYTVLNCFFLQHFSVYGRRGVFLSSLHHVTGSPPACLPWALISPSARWRYWSLLLRAAVGIIGAVTVSGREQGLMGRIYFNGWGSWGAEKGLGLPVTQHVRSRPGDWTWAARLPGHCSCCDRMMPFSVTPGGPRSLWDWVLAFSALTALLKDEWWKMSRWMKREKMKKWQNEKSSNIQLFNFSSLLHFSHSDGCVVVLHRGLFLF